MNKRKAQKAHSEQQLQEHGENANRLLRANSMASQVWTIKQMMPIYHPKAVALPLQGQWVCRGV